MAAAKALSFLLVVAGWGVTNEQQAEAVFAKNRTWFEFAVREVANSRSISSIPLPGDFFDEENKAKLTPSDQRIYLDVQAGMKQAIVGRISVVGAGSDVKKAVSFIMDNELFNPRVMEIMAVGPGYSPELFISPDTKCRPLIDARWYVCRID